jgi:Reverse transcriptase (RNA-dependent DNA polymerase)
MLRRFDLELLQYDAVNAFVDARLEEDVYMKMPPGHRRNGTILKLNKALYRLWRSPLLWQREHTQSLKRLGFEQIPHEPCCFIKDGIILFFYVDNIVIAFGKHQETDARSLIEKL